MIGTEAEYHPPDDELRYRLSRVYRVLDSVREDRLASGEYRQYIQSELDVVTDILDTIRQRKRFEEEEVQLQNSAIDELLEDVAGRLVAPATAAMKAWRDLQRERDVSFAEILDEESLVMIKTALRVGNLLESNPGSFPNIETNSSSTHNRATKRPRQTVGNRDFANNYQGVDFTPGAQGVWKAFEREINLSVIQAARSARNVTMPDFFGLYDPSNKVRSKVQTGNRDGRPIFRDINQLDKKCRFNRHRFLSLGDALFVTRAVQGRRTERFDTIIDECLQESLPSHLICAWERIHEIRNQASHIQPLSYNDYRRVVEDALSQEVLGSLMRIKQHLSH